MEEDMIDVSYVPDFRGERDITFMEKKAAMRRDQ